MSRYVHKKTCPYININNQIEDHQLYTNFELNFRSLFETYWVLTSPWLKILFESLIPVYNLKEGKCFPHQKRKIFSIHEILLA